jgi:hypothetical protein
MNLFDTDPSPPAPTQRVPLPLSDLDAALTAQFAVAWAGETGEEPRLGWWRTDLVSEFGGMGSLQTPDARDLGVGGPPSGP